MTRQEILDMSEGRELDKLVAEKIFGFKQLGYYGPPKDGSFWHHVDSVWYATADEANAAYAAYWDKNHKDNPGGFIGREELDADLQYWADDWGPLNCPDYSTDIAEAWRVVDKVAMQWLAGSMDEGDTFFRFIKSGTFPFESEGVGETMPLAICRAALLTCCKEGQ